MSVVSLGHQPLCDDFRPHEHRDTPYTVYPLDLLYCKDCGLAQIGYAVDPNLLFRDFVYTTQSNPGSQPHFAALVDTLVKDYALGPGDLALDIASNDGTLLAQYNGRAKVLGVDPSSATKFAIDKGIPTLVDFFNEKTAEKITREHGKAKVATMINAFAHVRDLDPLMAGVAHVLDDRGVFVSESHHLYNLVRELQYDHIHHEHLRFYSLRPLQTLFQRFGLEMIDVVETHIQGGSIRVFAAKKGQRPISPNVQRVIDKEKAAGLYEPATFEKFGERVRKSRTRLMRLLFDLKEKGATIAGIGAPAKSTCMLTYCHIGPDLVSYIVEHTPLKIGKLAPGSQIPVEPEEKLLKEQPDYGLLFAWNVKDIIIPKLRKAGYRGRFILPSEEPSIVD